MRLTNFISTERALALLNRVDLPEQCSGSALFADVAGFTSLAESLSTILGLQRSAEELTNLLNLVYTGLIEQVALFGGSVISFVGDAILCWFDDQVSPETALRATACALAMQEVMQQFNNWLVAPNLNADITIKVGIACGPARRMVAGDSAIQLLEVLTGETLRQMTLAEGLAQRREIILAPSACALLRGKVRFTERQHPGTGHAFGVVAGLFFETPPTILRALPAIPIDEKLPPELLAWVLPGLRQYLRPDDQLLLPQLRPAAALFVRFSGIDYDHDPHAAQKLKALIAFAQGVIHHQGGDIIQLTVGDKGSFFYAAFGAPIAHEDDALRALRSALNLQKYQRRNPEGLSLQIGLASGQARTGIYGGYQRFSYGVIGKEVVLACRLMESAPANEIYVSESITHAVGGKINFENLGMFNVKGRSESVAIYRPLERLKVHQQTSLVGRESEISVFRQLIATLNSRETRVFVLEGEAGIGKSRLVNELAELAHAEHYLTFLGAGQSTEQHSPYRAWREIMGDYFGKAEVLLHIQALVPEKIEWAPLLNDVLDIDLPENALTASLTPALRQSSLALLLTELLRVRAPLVLILEDAQWCDSLSWQLALHLVRARVPMLLFIAMRETQNETLVELKILAETQVLQLAALPRLPLETLIADRLQVSRVELSPALVNLIADRSGGNPFFVEELILELQARAAQVIKIPDTALAEIFITLPDSLHGLILARIDRLSAERQFVLKTAAVIGRSFMLEPLQQTLAHFDTQLESLLHEHLSALEAADFTVLEKLVPELSYIFKHVLTQEAAYQTLLFSQRREIHLLVAGWYETQLLAHPNHLNESLPVLVYHYHQAEVWEKERFYARLAGAQAARQYANAEALRFFNRAVDLTASEDILAHYDLQLAVEDILHLTGERQIQLQSLAVLAQLAAKLGSPSKQTAVLYRQARYAEAIADFPQALVAAQATVTAAGQADELNLAAAGHLIWGRILMRQDLDAAYYQMEQALTLAQSCNDDHLQVEALGWLGRVLPERHPALAQSQLTQALKLSRELNDRQIQGQILHHLAVFSVAIHYDYGQAIKRYRQAIEVFQTIGDLNSEAASRYNLAVNLMHLGQFAEAQACTEATLKIASQVADQEQLAFSLELLGRLAEYRGEASRAQAYFEQALRVVQPLGNDGLQGGILTNLAYLLIGLDDLSQAEACLMQAKGLRESCHGPEAIVDELAGLAYLEFARGNLARASEYTQQFLELLQANPGLPQANDPARDVLSVYRVLKTCGHPAAQILLAQASGEINRRAALLSDLALRQSFLELVPDHREILETYQLFQGESET